MVNEPVVCLKPSIMRSILIITALIFTQSMGMFAQVFVKHSNNDKTLLSKSSRFGVFWSLSGDYQLNGQLNLYTVESALAFNLGNGYLGFYGAASDEYTALNHFGDMDLLKLAHGGVWLGVNPWQDKVIHPFIDAKIGAGAVDVYLDNPGHSYYDTNALLALNGNIGVEVNLSRVIRLNAYYGKRIIEPFYEAQFDATELNGQVLGFGLRVGFFGKKRSGTRFNFNCNDSY